MSRIWQHAYGLRAELIAHLRLSRQGGYEGQAEDHRQAALREESQLKNLIAEYIDAYGQKLIRYGEAEFQVEASKRLGWWVQRVRAALCSQLGGQSSLA